MEQDPRIAALSRQLQDELRAQLQAFAADDRARLAAALLARMPYDSLDEAVGATAPPDLATILLERLLDAEADEAAIRPEPARIRAST